MLYRVEWPEAWGTGNFGGDKGREVEKLLAAKEPLSETGGQAMLVEAFMENSLSVRVRLSVVLQALLAAVFIDFQPGKISPVDLDCSYLNPRVKRCRPTICGLGV